MTDIDCGRLGELLCDFVNGELADELRQVLEAHLAACPPCVVHVETYRLTVTMTRKLQPVRIPSDVMCRLREAIRREFPHV
ncbi:MAG: zf-HC2 domain-containing protein [Gemmataceae bacterium]